MADTQPITPRRARALARRRRLLEATFEIVGRRGVEAATHRAVAALADVPLGSTTYYFATREQMLTEALDHCARTEIEALSARLARVASESSGADELVEALTDYVMDQLGPERWKTIAQYALLQEAARRPELRDAADSWSASLGRIFASAFERLGSTHPELDARMFLAMLDGSLMTALAAPDSRREQLRADVRAEIARFVWFVQRDGAAR